MTESRKKLLKDIYSKETLLTRPIPAQIGLPSFEMTWCHTNLHSFYGEQAPPLSGSPAYKHTCRISNAQFPEPLTLLVVTYTGMCISSFKYINVKLNDVTLLDLIHLYELTIQMFHHLNYSASSPSPDALLLLLLN